MNHNPNTLLFIATTFIPAAFAGAEPPPPAPPAIIAPAPQAPAKVEERYYTVSLMGSKMGTMTTITTTSDSKIITQSAMDMTIKRGTITMKIGMASSFLETLSGEPISMRSTQNLGATGVHQDWVFPSVDNPEGKVVHTFTQGDASSTNELEPLTVPWLTPAAAERSAKEQFLAGAKEIKVTTIDANTGYTAIGTTRRVGAKEKIKVDGAEIEAIRCDVTIDQPGMPASVEYIDSEGELLQSTTSLGGMQVLMTRTTKAGASKTTPQDMPEIMLSTFVKPSVPILRPRDVTSATYVLRVSKGDLPELPSAGAQAFERKDHASGTLRVLTDRHHPASTEDAADPAFLASTSAANAKDESIVEFTRAALADAKLAESPDNAAKARALRDAVHGHIHTKNLNVALGTASEVVRTREGDCTEHGVLLATALRAANIPSRVVTGLIYADQFAGAERIFGYHMWAQALLDDKASPSGKAWVDLDATLPDNNAFDATHIAMGVSALGDGASFQDLLPIAGVLGVLEIDVQSVARGKP